MNGTPEGFVTASPIYPNTVTARSVIMYDPQMPVQARTCPFSHVDPRKRPQMPGYGDSSSKSCIIRRLSMSPSGANIDPSRMAADHPNVPPASHLCGLSHSHFGEPAPRTLPNCRDNGDWQGSSQHQRRRPKVRISPAPPAPPILRYGAISCAVATQTPHRRYISLRSTTLDILIPALNRVCHSTGGAAP